MATKVHMEALSPTMEEGQLVQWLKAEGDAIASGDVLAEIETDKATMELVARGDGVLRKIFLDAGGTAEVGAVIGVIASEDEDISGIRECPVVVQRRRLRKPLPPPRSRPPRRQVPSLLHPRPWLPRLRRLLPPFLPTDG